MGISETANGTATLFNAKRPDLHASHSSEHLHNSGVSVPAKHQVPFNGLSFHNPFDVNSYPLTNPPLYDPSTIPYGVRRRRISISNGQIGQIVNHEAFYMDEDSAEDYYDRGHAMQAQHHVQHHGHQHGHVPHHIQPHEMPPAPAALAGVPHPGQPGTSRPVVGSVQAPMVADLLPIAPNSVNMHLSEPPAESLPEGAGVPPPNTTLVYNNEVIYNPHDGPIPGTAAWKKERLLERNRLAAAKCRQRKKTAQQQLQSNMARFEMDLKVRDSKLEKAEKLLALYNSALQRHFAGAPGALEDLRPFVSQSLDNIALEPES